MPRKLRSNSTIRQSNSHRSKSWAVVIPRFCQAIVLGVLCYSAWRYGGAETVVQWQIAVGLSTAVGLGLIFVESRETTPPPRTGLCLLCFAWLLWGGLQVVPLPAELAAIISPGAAGTRAAFDQTLAEPEDQSAESRQTLPPESRTISIIPAASRLRLSVNTLGVAAFVIGSTLFATSKGRRWLLMGLAANGGAIAAWSIIQRATNASHVIPGVRNEVFTGAFSTFHYRNAGAAYLLIGLAAAVGVLIWTLVDKRLWYFGGLKKQKSNPLYSHSGAWSDLSVVASVALLLLIGFAILLSMSRGAWACAVVGLGVISLAGLAYVGWRAILAFVVCAVALTTGCTYLVAQHERIETRSADLTLDQITANDRFVHFWAGLDTALHYLPTGSGIGTYGYAHLPFKHRDTRAWFENAHNQYLEVVTESGIVGIAIVVIGIVLLARRSWSLFTRSKEPSRIAMGAAGCVALIAVVGQGFVDFVITYPANMMAAGLLLGAVSGCERRVSSKSTGLDSVPSPKPRLGFSVVASGPFAWLLLLTLPLLFSQYVFGRELHYEHVLAVTVPPGDDVVPTLSQCTENSQLLHQLTQEMPDHAIAWQRYAWWQTAELRLHILARKVQQEPSTIESLRYRTQWIAQSPLGWFESFLAGDPQQQAALRKRLAPEDEDRRLLRSAFASLSRANEMNPLIPQVQLSCATLAPWIADDWRPHVERLTQLARSNPDQLYSAGLLYFMVDDQEASIDAWKRYLAIASPRRDTILSLASKKWEPETVVERLFPAKVDLLIAMNLRALREEAFAGTVELWRRRCEQVIQSDETLSSAERHACYAQLAQLDSDFQLAAEHWQNASKAAPSNIFYRLRLATTFLKLGDDRSAQYQTLAARALGASDRQLDPIRAAIKRHRDRKAPR
ncbi:O-Antigen ligase [Rosistilla ulvae]|uniref:O-Antigen ligase n=1 Tax=Rosistilla ulvae TaxID=1930277 RepID=A0A517LX69_9BACT|nr:O-antigen ligase family protein [Rosistilla ulvae]QDS87224.1 O-Antigen ligase [Rosistilla ulvae]